MDFLKLKLNLQFFSADDASGGDNSDGVTADGTDTESVITKLPDDDEVKTFTQEEVDDMIKKRVARTEKDKQDAIDEAKKLAGLNAAEKQKYEYDKIKKENDDLKLEKNRYSLGREATKMLTELGVAVDDETLDFVVREDADATKKAVKSFSDLITKKVNEGVKGRLRQETPKVSGGIGGDTKQPSLEEMAQEVRIIKN